MTGHWVRYKLFYENKEVSIQNHEDGWMYEYLCSYYPEHHVDKKDWERVLRDYICDGRTYTCILEEVNIKQVPKEILRVEKQHMEARIWQEENHIKLLKKELKKLMDKK